MGEPLEWGDDHGDGGEAGGIQCLTADADGTTYLLITWWPDTDTTGDLRDPDDWALELSRFRDPACRPLAYVHATNRADLEALRAEAMADPAAFAEKRR